VSEVETGEEALEAALSITGPLAADKGVRLTWDRNGARTRYLGDARRVEQILVNLLGNAVKFTPPGGRVTVTCGTCEWIPEGASARRMVYLAVEDTGIGVPPEKRELIFGRFVQGESGYRRPHEGAGLGLAISRELARRMGGDITVDSGSEGGSRFTLYLPAAEREETSSGSSSV
jgi:signal transduction histidine kinase